MASSRQLISSQVLGTSATSVTFSAIPGTFKDLVLRVSGRTDNADTMDNLKIVFNGNTATNYSYTELKATPSAGSESSSNMTFVYGHYGLDAASNTTNTFSSNEIYIPSYTASQNKPLSLINVLESNSTTLPFTSAQAQLWRNTAAITSIVLSSSNAANFVSGSSFYLYGLAS